MSIQLERDDFSFEAAKTLSSLFDNPDFSDVTLVCEDQKQVFAHKAILSANSSFFQKIFGLGIFIFQRHLNIIVQFF